MEIVTWVLQGSLVHQDSEGNKGVLYPGLAQRMSAGTGIRHSEKNDAWRQGVGGVHDEPVRFIQMWVPPDEARIKPGYEQLEIDDALLRGGLVPVASGRAEHKGAAAISIGQEHAALYAARVAPGGAVSIPDAPFVHLFVADGSVDLEGSGLLETGDAARITGGAGQRVTAGPAGAEVLVWEMHARLAG
jgi:redox-sensitive bicupin YhaK (pirin superfamily)